MLSWQNISNISSFLGVILSSVVSFNPQKPPFLVVLDAKSFKEIARATIDAAIHVDLHGLFIHDKST